MNFNNYNNPYNQYPYTNYQQPNYNNGYNQFQQQQPQQQNYMNLLVVNGYEDVEKYIVMANQTVNFYDNKNGYIFVKSADGIGKYTIKSFKLNEVDINNIGKNNEKVNEYAKMADFNVLNEKVNTLSSQIENLLKTPKKEDKINE